MPILLRSQKIMSFVLSSIALIQLSACGGSLREKFGKKDEKKAQPFRIEAKWLPGIYVINWVSPAPNGRSIVTNSPLLTRADDALAEHMEIWNVTATQIEIVAVDPNKPKCAVRDYAVVGHEIVIAEAGTCAETRIDVVRQTADMLEIRREPFSIGDRMFDAISYWRYSSEELQRSVLYEIDFDFSKAPDWLKRLQPHEADEASMNSARTSFRDEKVVGSTMHVAAGKIDAQSWMSGISVADGTAQEFKLSFTWFGQKPTDCMMSAPTDLAHEISKNGIDLKIAEIVVRHSQRSKGTWRLTASGEEISKNVRRRNNLDFSFTNAPKGFSLNCSRPSGPEVIRWEHIKYAVGEGITFSR